MIIHFRPRNLLDRRNLKKSLMDAMEELQVWCAGCGRLDSLEPFVFLFACLEGQPTVDMMDTYFAHFRSENQNCLCQNPEGIPIMAEELAKKIIHKKKLKRSDSPKRLMHPEL
jgi:hypothetical protein